MTMVMRAVDDYSVLVFSWFMIIKKVTDLMDYKMQV